MEKPLLEGDLPLQFPHSKSSVRSTSANEHSAPDSVGPQRRKLYRGSLNLKQEKISIRFFGLLQKFVFSCHGPSLHFSSPGQSPAPNPLVPRIHIPLRKQRAHLGTHHLQKAGDLDKAHNCPQSHKYSAFLIILIRTKQ